MKDQSYCQVNRGRPCIFYLAAAFWNTGALPQETPLDINISWKD